MSQRAQICDLKVYQMGHAVYNLWQKHCLVPWFQTSRWVFASSGRTVTLPSTSWRSTSGQKRGTAGWTGSGFLKRLLWRWTPSTTSSTSCRTTVARTRSFVRSVQPALWSHVSSAICCHLLLLTYCCPQNFSPDIWSVSDSDTEVSLCVCVVRMSTKANKGALFHVLRSALTASQESSVSAAKTDTLTAPMRAQATLLTPTSECVDVWNSRPPSCNRCASLWLIIISWLFIAQVPGVCREGSQRQLHQSPFIERPVSDVHVSQYSPGLPEKGRVHLRPLGHWAQDLEGAARHRWWLDTAAVKPPSNLLEC